MPKKIQNAQLFKRLPHLKDSIVHAIKSHNSPQCHIKYKKNTKHRIGQKPQTLFKFIKKILIHFYYMFEMHYMRWKSQSLNP